MRADRVLGEIIHRLVSLGTSPEQRFDIACDLAPVTLSAERIVPFSLLMTEALTNAIKSLAQIPAPAARWIEVTLQPETDGRVRLRLVRPCHGHDVSGPGALASVGDDLIEAFALQMDASLHQDVVVGPRGQARVAALVFPPDDGSAKASSAGLPAPTAPGVAS
jgi:two-component sensor histidine kinase